MTRLQATLAGICIGMAGLAALGAGVWHYVLEEEGPQILERKWHVSEIEHLRGKAPPGDVWQVPGSPLIEPLSVLRAEWNETAFRGPDSWGYFLYYKARVKDAQLSQHLRAVEESELRALPASAMAHEPAWWTPQKSIPRGGLTELGIQSDNVFIETKGEEVFLYWMKSHEG